MALSDHISNLITAYSEMPNGHRRNKVLSHLKDAEAHAVLMEQEQAYPSVQPHPLPDSLKTIDECICQPGMRDRACTATAHVA